MLNHWTKKIIVEEGHTVAQLVHILYVGEFCGFLDNSDIWFVSFHECCYHRGLQPAVYVICHLVECFGYYLMDIILPGCYHRVPTPAEKSWIFVLKFTGPGKSWKVSLVLENPEICLWFNLTNMPFVYRTPCVNKCMKYSCYVLTEHFLCNLWLTFCVGLYCYTVYTE